jgi:AAA domain
MTDGGRLLGDATAVENRRATAALVLARSPEAMEALLRGLPVPRGRLRLDVLTGIGQPAEGPDFVLTDDDALRVTLWQPNGSSPGQQSAFDSEAVETLPFEILTTRAIADLPDPPVSDQLLGPLVVRAQRTIIGAHTGEGKTTLGMQIVAAIAERRELLGWKGPGGRALVIDLEQGLRTVKRRIREADLGSSETVDYLRVPDGLALDQDMRHIAAVEKVLEAGGYELVYLDPFYKAHRGDSNEEKEQTAFMRRLDDWRDRHGFALLLSTHCRKPPPGQKASLTIHDLFGSSAIVRGAEVVVAFNACGLATHGCTS